MNVGYIVALLGVLGLGAGGAMYATNWHHTAGEAGIGLGLILVLIGFWYSRQKPIAAIPQS